MAHYKYFLRTIQDHSYASDDERMDYGIDTLTEQVDKSAIAKTNKCSLNIMAKFYHLLEWIKNMPLYMKKQLVNDIINTLALPYEENVMLKYIARI